MAKKPSADALFPGVIAAVVGSLAFLGALLAALLPDLPIAVRWSVFSALATFLLSALYYYLALGGGDEHHTSSWRREFVSVRKSLELGGAFNALYARYLTRALDALDRFFGDTPLDALAKLARGAEAPPRAAQCWSAKAYDRCLLLALRYPLLTLFAVWAVSGHAGDAERAIGLGESPPQDIGWRLI
ncbi:MAG: hypothetical protein ACLPN5_15200, partial [Roseiarcus sp.]